MQIGLAIFVILIGGMAVTYLFGIRLFGFVKPKLDATDRARILLGTLSCEVRSAARIKVGSGDSTSFTEAAINTAQSGTAIQIYPGSDTNVYIRYFSDSSDQSVKRLVKNGNTVIATVASSVTNSAIFSAQDYAGNVLTNNSNNRVISMTLQFFEKEALVNGVGAGKASDFFQLRTRITRRSLL